MKTLSAIFARINRFFVTAIIFLVFVNAISAQTFSDGPMELKIRLRDVYVGFNETDAPILGGNFAPDEILIRVWAIDSTNVSGLQWQGGILHQFAMGTDGIASMPGTTPLINDTLFDFSYTTAVVPEFFNLKVEAWEDDIPSDSLLGYCMNGDALGFDTLRCCGNLTFGTCIGLSEGDDKYCNTGSFSVKLPYRNGPPFTWFDQGYITGTCGSNWEIGIETYWSSPNVSVVPSISVPKGKEVSIYPNPASNSWHVTIPNNLLAVTAEVLDAIGRVVFKSEIVSPNFEINFDALSGIYLLRINSSHRSITEKLVRW